LHGLFGEKCLLNGMEPIAVGETLDGRNRFVFDIGDRRQTGAAGNIINKNGAGAALTFAASVFGSGEIELFAKNGKQARLGIGVDWPLCGIYKQARNSCHKTSLCVFWVGGRASYTHLLSL
jgi:hypothetical protein